MDYVFAEHGIGGKTKKSSDSSRSRSRSRRSDVERGYVVYIQSVTSLVSNHQSPVGDYDIQIQKCVAVLLEYAMGAGYCQPTVG